MTPLTVTVLGAGSWGTTLAHLVASNGHSTALWTRSADDAREVNDRHTNSRYTGALAIDHRVTAITDLGEALRSASLVIVAVPSQAFRDVCRAAGEWLRPHQLLIHATKGLELGTLRRMSEIVIDETCTRQLGVLSGPNIAPEIAEGSPAGTMIASPHPRVIEVGRLALGSARFMVFAGDDVRGVELAGAFKNVVAIAAGIADALNVGENAKALLVTRGLAEMMRLAAALGAVPTTLTGLAGIGDLMVTCRSVRSRNHRVGVGLAEGATLSDIVSELGMVAEGVYAARAANELVGRLGIHLPLFEQVHRVLYEGLPAKEALDALMRLRGGRDVSRFVER